MFNRQSDYQFTSKNGTNWEFWLEQDRECDDDVVKNYWQVKRESEQVRSLENTLPTYNVPSKAQFIEMINKYEDQGRPL